MSGRSRGRPGQHGGRQLSTGRRRAGDGWELEVPLPFTMEEFAARLERRSGRPAKTVPLEMGPGAPSGIFLRDDRADYLCYEQVTSRFHQVHIVVSLAAHAIADGTRCEAPDQRPLPDASHRLPRLILGGDASTLTWAEAEAFAFETLGRSGLTDCPPDVAQRLATRLQPLHTTLAAIVREKAASAAEVRHLGDAGDDPGLRLHQIVIGIWEAMLALRPFQNPGETAATPPGGRLTGLTSGDLVAKTVATLAAVVRERDNRDRAELPAGERNNRATGGHDLRGDAEWLARVAGEFGELPLAED